MCFPLNNHKIQVEKSTYCSYVAMAVHGTSTNMQQNKSIMSDAKGHYFVNNHSLP